MTQHEERLLRQSKRQRRAIVILVDANERLRSDMLRKEKELYGLIDANANLRGKLGVVYALLGEAMDEPLPNSGQPKG
jgi:hypothetical protein